MAEWWNVFVETATGPMAFGVGRALVKAVAGLILARLGSRGVERLLVSHADANQTILAQRLAYYGILGLFLASALTDLGFDLTVLLGAAGIATVALGFASQTSASNVISGIFLLGEKPFAVGDVIRVGTTVGEVLSVDLLSVKLRTFDNLLVRIPNETMIKSEITNLARFPIRRYDLQVGVAYKEDLDRVREVLLEVADRNPICLEEPEPLIIFQGYGESSLNFQFSVWAQRENYLEVRNTIPVEVKRAFDRAGIEIPFPHRSLYAGSETDPLPVEMVDSAAAPPPDEPGPAGAD